MSTLDRYFSHLRYVGGVRAVSVDGNSPGTPWAQRPTPTRFPRGSFQYASVQRRGLPDQLQPKGYRILSEGDCKFVDKTLVRECGLRSIDRTPSANRHRRLCHHEFHTEVRRTVSDVIGRFGRPLVEATLNVLGLPAPFPLLPKRWGHNAMIPRHQPPFGVKASAHHVAARRTEVIVRNVVFA